MDNSEILTVAKNAAICSGKIQMDYLKKVHHINFKGEINLVTEVDLLCEKTIIEILNKHYPEFGILAEESGQKTNNSPYKWIIDPLDGTTNFAHQFPFFCTSIALELNKEVILGVVYDPVRKELFHSTKGNLAFLNDKPICVSNINKLDRAMLATGFPYDIKNSHEPILKILKKFLTSTQAIRRAGSAALDLCYVACGRLDGFWEKNLKPWDTAAGVLIVQEAGGKVTDFKRNLHNNYKAELIGANKFIHEKMIGVFQS